MKTYTEDEVIKIVNYAMFDPCADLDQHGIKHDYKFGLRELNYYNNISKSNMK